MPNRSARSVAIIFAVLLSPVAGAGDAEELKAPLALFAAAEPLELTLTADFKTLRSRKSWESDRWHEGSISLEGDLAQRVLPVRLRVRGGFRTRDDNCNFPQFFVDVTGADTLGTVFEGQEILALTTHCRGSSVYSRYIHREFIAYRIYNLLTDKSLRVRSALFTYMRSDKPVKVARRYGFFVEHFDAMASRLGTRHVDLDVFHPAAGDAFEMGVLELFEFMIGNTDFSAAYEHNIVLMQLPGQKIFGVPYDFDFSGLVNARYAAPASQFRTRSVRTRIYRGWCRDEADFDEVVAHFQTKRAEIFELLDEFDWMPVVVIKDAEQYLRSFYDVLDSPRELDRQIRTKCATGVPVRGE
ncbi:MAG: hypothetical protein HKN59_09540 [Gammaproteobacteria bacterium]|nr:hypothetical protein [Gammaproteobacteria bacterium]